MTQKEYKENIEKYEKEIKDLKEKLQEEIRKNNKYNEMLEHYYDASVQLKAEQRYNQYNLETIQNQNKIIEKYENILARFTINA